MFAQLFTLLILLVNVPSKPFINICFLNNSSITMIYALNILKAS